MMAFVGRIASEIRASFWFVPALITLLLLLLAYGATEIDLFFGREAAARWPSIFGHSAEGSRGMLETIGSSMLTVAGVVFSITIVSLTLASNQYTSRILRNFMRDRSHQVSLGVFVGIYAYCLFVLRNTQGEGEGAGIPVIAVTIAYLLAIFGIAVLIHFIHHVATSIQASNVIAGVSGEVEAAIEALLPPPHPPGEAKLPPASTACKGEWLPLAAEGTGYIQWIDEDKLAAVAERADVSVRMERAVGDFVSPGSPLAMVAGAPLTAELRKGLLGGCVVSRWRLVHVDLIFGIQQIVDIALKAISPAVNDPRTAEICIDYLGAILVRIVGRPDRPSRVEREGILRLERRESRFEDFLREATQPLCRSAAGQGGILLKQLDMLEMVATRVSDEDRCRAVAGECALICEVAERTVHLSSDRMRIQAKAHGLRTALGRAPGPSAPAAA